MKENKTPQPNQIKEIAPGVFWVLLWCPESSLLSDLLDPQTEFVLCWDHTVETLTWQPFRLPILAPHEQMDVLSRLVTYDFIMPTKQFLDILPRMPAAIKAVQVNTIPPYYFDMRRLRGKELFRLLRECGWHVLIDTPANDFGQIMSPSRDLLQRAIDLTRNGEP